MVTITGTSNIDILNDDDHNNLILGYSGSDTITATSGGADTIYGHGGDDIIISANNHATIYGGSGDDYLAGGYGTDTLMGGQGADTIIGDFRDNILNNNSTSHDIIDGGSGNDVLKGGQGDDTLKGYIGNDTFLYDSGHLLNPTNFGHDIIKDFEGAGAANGDIIQFNDEIFATINDVLDAISYSDGNALITYDSENTVTLLNIGADSLSADDFEIVTYDYSSLPVTGIHIDVNEIM